MELEQYDIILVDDEEMTLLLFDTFTTEFYSDIRTKRYKSPQKAVEEIKNGKVTARIWMVDLMMTEMDGVHFTEYVQKYNPESQVCFYTALSLDIVQHYFPGLKLKKIINKTDHPIEETLAELVKLIRKRKQNPLPTTVTTAPAL